MPMVRYENLGLDLLLENGDLTIGSTGDLEVTTDGRITLLQDVTNLLETLPGDLFGHPDYGSGLSRLSGEEDTGEYKSLVSRAIADALIYDTSVAPRIETESIQVTKQSNGHELFFDVSFIPIGEDETTRLNLVWGKNANEEDL